MLVLVTSAFNLVEEWWDITHFIKVVRPYLTDMEINEVVVVGINFNQFIPFQLLSIDIVLNVNVFVFKDN